MVAWLRSATVRASAVFLAIAALVPLAPPDPRVSATTITSGGITTSATAQAANFSPGDTVSISARVTSSTAGAFLVFAQVTGPTAGILGQFTFDNEPFNAGVERVFAIPFALPGNAAIGGYTVKLFVYTPNFGQVRHINEGAGFFTVGMASPPPAGGPVRIMPLGDSLTDGITADGGYRVDLWTLLATAGHPVDFVGSRHNGMPGLADKHHEGHSGWRIDELAGGLTPWLAAFRPQIVLLLIGTNDMRQDYDVVGAPARLSALIDQIRSGAPDAAIIVASLPRNANGDVQARILAFNAAIPGVVATKGSKVSFLDIYPAIEVVHLAGDGIHLTANGYGRLAQTWFPPVDAILKSQFPTPTPTETSTPTLTHTPTATPTPSHTPTVPILPCSPRPRINVSTVPAGAGRLTVTIAATGTGNGLRELRVIEAKNAIVEAAGLVGRANFTVPLPGLPPALTFSVTRDRPGEPVHVPLVVEDTCGNWPTFVGGGATAF